MIYLLPTLALTAGLIMAYRFVMSGHGRWVIWLGALCMVITAWALFQGRAQDNGWDAIGYAILAALGMVPILLGLGLGSLLGLYRRRKARQKPGHD